MLLPNIFTCSARSYTTSTTHTASPCRT